MGVQKSDGRMEGWLYLIRFNRFGLQYSRKRYFILEGNYLKSFKSIPTSDKEEPARSATIDSCIRITDNGRESSYRKVFFIFTLHNTSNHNDYLKLGASSPEEAARWIHSLQNAALNLVSCSKRNWQPFRAFDGLCVLKRSSRESSIDWTSSASVNVDAMTSDVIDPSPWKIFGCRNGLRLFKESKDKDSSGKRWDNHPSIMAVGVVDGTSEAIFRTLMSIGPSRSEWDFCFYGGRVVEHLDGHTDIIHMQVYKDWLAWGMHQRDFLLRRYWRREDNGTYVILYHSVYHRKCPPQHGYIRACLKSGGFVVTPLNNGKESVVKHMLAIDWMFRKSYLRKSYARSRTIRMLERVAALREMFRAKAGNFPSDFPSEFSRDIGLPQIEKEDIKTEVPLRNGDEKPKDEADKRLSVSSSLLGFNNATDEFFDIPEPFEDGQLENDWSSDRSQECQYQETCQPKPHTAANFVKKLHNLAVQRKGYMDLQEFAWEDNVSCCYGSTLPNDSSCSLPCSWAAADPSTFLIRGKSYLENRQKIKAKGALMDLIAADWLKSDKREDDLGGRPGGIVQKYAAQGGPEFFFIVNMQVPGTTTYSLALYYMMSAPLRDSPLLERFVNEDDAYRSSRFKLIPYISEGSWIVKQSVGKKAGLVGQALQVNYFRGKNYLELDIDVGSSTVARGVVSLVLKYLNNLVIEMAFLIQADTHEELPEFLLGTCRLNHLDASKSVSIDAMIQQ